jgi:light-regulated signal transduction histidine kinase (bacteriophytochrome)
LLRRLLPLSILLMGVIVGLRLVDQAAGLFAMIEFRAATVATTAMISASGALVWCAALLDRLDRQRFGSEVRIYQLNVALRERIAALEAANRELEGFSYAMSHVLLAPLRAIDGFSQILLDEHAVKLDSEGDRLLRVVRASAREVHDLIDGILGFLRLGWARLSAGPIDMAAAVRTVLMELEPKTRGRELKIELARLPGAFGDAEMIRLVWMNLLDNAIKFTAQKPDAHIEVGAITGDDETVYFVRDNGVGFDMQFADKLFGVFDRLHGSEFAGNGMGLASARRIVTRHDGRVWAEGKLSEGTTFYFALPNKETSRA